MEEQNGMQIPIGFREKKQFMEINGKKLLFENITHFEGLGNDAIYASRGALTSRWNRAMENDFDILGWMNSDTTNCIDL